MGVLSRPDIMYAVGVLTRHLKHPTYLSCKVACCMLNYLSHHAAMSITYSGSKIYDKHVYTDCDWSSDGDTRRSTSRYVVCMAVGPVDLISSAYCDYVFEGGRIRVVLLCCAGACVNSSVVA